MFGLQENIFIRLYKNHKPMMIMIIIIALTTRPHIATADNMRAQGIRRHNCIRAATP